MSWAERNEKQQKKRAFWDRLLLVSHVLMAAYVVVAIAYMGWRDYQLPLSSDVRHAQNVATLTSLALK